MELEARTQWVGAIAEVLARVDGEGFAPALVSALRQLVASNRAYIHIYPHDRKPRPLFDELGNDPGSRDLSLVGGYLLDPCQRMCREEGGEGFFTARELLADSVEVDEPVIRHVAYLVGVSDGTSLGLQLSRLREEEAYSPRDFELYRAVQPAVAAALRLHWRVWAHLHVPDAGEESQLYTQVEFALDRFGSGILTPRECQVVRLLLRGNSTRGAATALGIATATAALHRKRAYAKLGVSSQGELFYCFIQSLPGSTGVPRAAARRVESQGDEPRAVSGAS